VNSMALIRNLKSELKKSRISYRDLAKELKITEAGVKKMFTRSDISLARAIEICKILNLSLSDLIEDSANTHRGELRFTDKQVEFFIKNIRYFHFYMKLAYEQKTPMQIQQEHHLSIKSLNTYLKKIEEMGLIRRHPKDRAQIVGGFPMAVNTGGTALEHVKFEIIERLLFRLKTTNEGTLTGAGLFITKQETEELKQKLAEILRDFTLLSSRNRKSRRREATEVSVMVVQTSISMFDGIKEI